MAAKASKRKNMRPFTMLERSIWAQFEWVATEAGRCLVAMTLGLAAYGGGFLAFTLAKSPDGLAAWKQSWGGHWPTVALGAFTLYLAVRIGVRNAFRLAQLIEVMNSAGGASDFEMKVAPPVSLSTAFWSILSVREIRENRGGWLTWFAAIALVPILWAALSALEPALPMMLAGYRGWWRSPDSAGCGRRRRSRP
jgi:hypothetical protein